MSFAHAAEAVTRQLADFPKSAAEFLADSMKAARDLGAYHAHKQFDHLGLADENFGISWDITPTAAKRFLEDKTPMDWRKVKGLQDGYLRSQSFWIQGVEHQSTLEDALQSIVSAVDLGTTQAAFREQFAEMLDGIKGGLAQTVFRTNTQAAYQQAQVASYMANPLVEMLTYVTAGDEAVREEHAEWEGITLPKDDDFWDDHIPPCGFNCRCVIRVSSETDTATALDDPRMDLPPDKGFEGPRGDALGTYIAAQAMQVPHLSPADTAVRHLAAEKDPLFDWMNATTPKGPLPKGSGRFSTPSQGFIEMPGGRVVALTDPAIHAAPKDAHQWIRAAIQGPSEAWAMPYKDPKGHIVLAINCLLNVEGRTLCVPVVSGTVPATGLPIRWVANSTEVRRGGRIL